MSEQAAEKLRTILEWYAQPDASIVGYIQRGGVNLAYVSHAEITRILIQVDPLWSWQPCGWENGRPQINVDNGMATMWGILTIHGKDMIGVGSARADKGDVEKELIGDFLRNAAMRFGICLNLWSKEANDDGGRPQIRATTTTIVSSGGAPRPQSRPAPTAPKAPAKAPVDATKKANAGNPASEKQLAFMAKLGKENNIPDLAQFASGVIGRAVNTLNVMNASEASQVIDRLMNPQPMEELFIPDDAMGEEEPF